MCVAKTRAFDFSNPYRLRLICAGSRGVNRRQGQPGLGRAIGYVTENGSPATDVHLSLLFLDGGDVKSSADATTDTEGKYEFHDLDPLLPDQTYHVFYISDREDRVYAWETPLITNLPPGAAHSARTGCWEPHPQCVGTDGPPPRTRCP